MNNFILTQILFFMLFIATCFYWIRSFSQHDNIVFKLPIWHRIPYMGGALIIIISSLNIFKASQFSLLDFNMFLIGCILMLGSTAFWDKHLNNHFKQ